MALRLCMIGPGVSITQIHNAPLTKGEAKIKLAKLHHHAVMAVVCLEIRKPSEKY
jgi:hypothetical protein